MMDLAVQFYPQDIFLFYIFKLNILFYTIIIRASRKISLSVFVPYLKISNQAC